MKLGFRIISAAALSACVATKAVGQTTADEANRLYLSLSGLWVEQDDADFHADNVPLFDGSQLTFDDGFGVAAAIGEDLGNSPFRIEFEYAYREAETETIETDFGTGTSSG